MTGPAPAVAPYVTTYASRTPYLTVDEWINAPTACDITDLVPDGTRGQQREALADCIVRASGWIDEKCVQVLAATTDAVYGRWRLTADCTVKVPLPRKPVLEVSAVLIGPSPTDLTALDDLSGVEIHRTGVIEIPVRGIREVGSRPIVQVTYVNGWPNTLTTADVTAGSSTLPVATALGIYPGTVLTVADGASTEQVQVDASYTAGAVTLPLNAPLGFGHAAGVSVSSLPPVVKQAAILLTTALVQTRGDDAIVLAAMTEPTQMTATAGEPAGNVAMAMGMLANLRRVW